MAEDRWSDSGPVQTEPGTIQFDDAELHPYEEGTAPGGLSIPVAMYHYMHH